MGNRLGAPEISTIISGQSPPSSAYNDAREGTAFYQGNADFGDLHPVPRVWTSAGPKRAKARDVLVSVRAPVGAVNMADHECVIGRGLAAVRAGVDSDPWFLFFALSHLRPELESRASGSTFPSINGSTLADLEIPAFALQEQASIGRVLRLVVEHVRREDHAIEETRDLKRAAMRSLLTFGTRGEPQRQTEIGLLPESWDIVPLGTLGRVGNGSTPRKSRVEFWDGGSVPWLTSAKVYDREITVADQFVTDTALRECHLPIVEPGAVLIAITGQGKTLGHSAVLRIRATVNQHLAYVATDLRRADPSYLRGYLETMYDRFRQVGLGGGSTKGALTCAFLRTVPVPMPKSIEEQREISGVFDAIDEKIEIHRRRRAMLDELLKSLLHKLMTGEIRIADLKLDALAGLPATERAAS